MDEHGNVDGFFIDLLKYIAAKEDWRITYVPGAFHECLDRLKNGEIDLLVSVASSKERARDFDFTNQHLFVLWAEVYAHEGAKIDSVFDLQGKTVSILKGDHSNAEFQTLLDQFGVTCRLVEQAEYAESLQALVRGEADAGIFTNIYVRLIPPDQPVEHTPIIFAPTKVYFAVKKQQHQDILAVLDRYFAAFHAEQRPLYHQFYKKWFTPSEHVIILEWLRWGVAVLAVAFGTAFAFSLILRKRVAQKTADLMLLNAELAAQQSALQHELTDRKRAEEALQEREALYRQMFQGHSAVKLLLDAESGTIVEANPAAVQFYGYPVEILQQMNIAQINMHSPEQIAGDIAAVRSRRSNYFEFQHRLASGAIRDVEIYSVPIDVNGRVLLYAIIHDVTARKQAEEQLRISLEKYRVLFEAFPIGVSVTDDHGNILEINRASERLLGVSNQDHIHRKFDGPEWQIIRPDRTPMPSSEYASVRALKEQLLIENVEMGIVKANQEITWLNVHAIPIPLEGYGVLITYHDITDRKRAEEALQAAKQDLQDLIYIASHDLQTPMVSMQGFVNNLIKASAAQLDEEGRYALQRLQANAERLHRLVLSLLDLSRLNTVKNPYRTFEPEDIVRDLNKDLDLLVKQTGAEISIGPMPALHGDEMRLTIVFRNLMVNALHYDGKRIVVGYRQSAYFVQDDGIGIAPHNLEKIFKPGERLKTLEVDGVGMGLTFCQKVIMQHQGRIWAESDGEGAGTTIYFTIGGS